MSAGSKRNFETTDDAAAADSDRRMQQRRSAQEGIAVTAAPQQVAVSSASVHPSSLLYRHALESVFAFCSLKELSAVHCVSKGWQSAVHSMRSLDASVELSSAALLQMLHSPLRRHIFFLSRSSTLPHPLVTLSCAQLALLVEPMQHLGSLSVILTLPAGDDASALPSPLLPRRIEDLTIEFADCYVSGPLTALRWAGPIRHRRGRIAGESGLLRVGWTRRHGRLHALTALCTLARSRTALERRRTRDRRSNHVSSSHAATGTARHQSDGF
jgi:hypothetical protein